MKPKISIIVPIYNCEKYLKRTIESVLKQTYNDFQLILLNDGSTDGTEKILKEIKDSRVEIITKKNTGISNTRNLGLSLAKGELITFLDSDDYVEKTYLETVINIYNTYKKPDIINFGFFSEVENENLEIKSSDKITYLEKYYKIKTELKNDFVNLWDSTMLYNIWNKVYKKKIIDKYKLQFPSYNWGEDIEFNRQYLLLTKTFYNSNKCFYHYIREREGSATTKYKDHIFETRKREFKEFNEYFELWSIPKEEYYEFSCRRYLERMLGCIENIFCSKNMTRKERHLEIKKIIKDPLTREALKYAKPRSMKIKIMLIPVKLQIVWLTACLGKTANIVKTKFPSIFNKLKNKR